jgi:hypothetical protein
MLNRLIYLLLKISSWKFQVKRIVFSLDDILNFTNLLNKDWCYKELQM